MVKYYAVQSGRNTGVFTNWSDAKAATEGYKGAVHKSFNTAQEAANFANSSSGYSASSGGGRSNYSSGTSTSSYGSSYGGSSRNSSSYSGSSGSSSGSSYGGSSTYSSSYNSNQPKQVVYTDGSSRGNGQYGASAGYGVYYGDNDPRNVSSKLTGDRQTNQRAELTAVNHALDNALAEARSGSGGNLEIRTDSQYSRNALTQWGSKWESNGYKTSTGSDVQNADLVMSGREKLAQLQALGKEVSITHVKGHDGNYGNEQADRLANEGAMRR